MFSFTIARIPSAAFSTDPSPMASAMACTALRAASASSCGKKRNVAEAAAQPELKRELGLRDITLFAITCIVGTRWIPAAAHAGAGSVTLWFLAAVLFMVPLVVVFLIPQDSRVVWPYFFGGTLAIALVATFPYRMGISVALEYRIRLNSGDLSQPGGRQE